LRFCDREPKQLMHQQDKTDILGAQKNKQENARCPATAGRIGNQVRYLSGPATVISQRQLFRPLSMRREGKAAAESQETCLRLLPFASGFEVKAGLPVPPFCCS